MVFENISRDSSKFKDFSPHELLSYLIGNFYTIAYICIFETLVKMPTLQHRREFGIFMKN